jgi:hypothetical protein
VTVVDAAIVNVQVRVDAVQPPAQELKSMSVPGAAVSVTVEPAGYVWMQVDPHAMFDPLVTVPVPDPTFVTVNVTAERVTKLASTLALLLIVNVQVSDVPVQAPLHDPNAENASGCAVRVTVVPGA